MTTAPTVSEALNLANRLASTQEYSNENLLELDAAGDLVLAAKSPFICVSAETRDKIIKTLRAHAEAGGDGAVPVAGLGEPVAWGQPHVEYAASRGQSKVEFWVSREDGERIKACGCGPMCQDIGDGCRYLRSTVKDAIEALERNSTSAPVVECLKAALAAALPLPAPSVNSGDVREVAPAAMQSVNVSGDGKAVIELGAVVIRFPIDAMQSALDGAWGMHIFDTRQKITDAAEFAEEFANELNRESENGTTLIHRMADKAFIEMLEQGAFGFDVHEDQNL